MREKLWAYKFSKRVINETQNQIHLWVKIDSELLDYWQREALEAIPYNSTAQRHYVQMAIVAMLLYQGNHSITYQKLKRDKYRHAHCVSIHKQFYLSTHQYTHSFSPYLAIAYNPTINMGV